MKTRALGLLVGLAAALPFAAASSRADVLELGNGVRVSGIVQAPSADGVTVQVSADGFLVLDPAEIVTEELEAPEANARLRAAWASRRRELAARRDEERRAQAVSAGRRDERAPAPAAQVAPNVTVVTIVNLFTPAPAAWGDWPAAFETPGRHVRRRRERPWTPAGPATPRPTFNVSGFGAFGR